MKRIALFAIAFLSLFTSAPAQSDKKPEFFGGYSFESVATGINSADLSTTTTFDNSFKANGFNVSGTGYFNKRFGITADFSGQYNSRTDVVGVSSGQSSFSLYNITAGPQFRFSGNGKFTPFVHALAGVARRNLTGTNGTTTITDNTTSFAMNFGGGLDYQVNKKFSVRLVQFDYNPIFLGSRVISSITFPSRTLNGFRFSTGIVIK